MTKLKDKNNPQLEYMFFEATMGLLAPTVRETLIEDADFRKKYSVKTKATISLGALGLTIDRDTFVEAVKEVLSGKKMSSIEGKNELKYTIEESEADSGVVKFTPVGNDGAPVSLSFFQLSPDRNVRLNGFRKAMQETFMPPGDVNKWESIFSERPLNGGEVDIYFKDILDTPVQMRIQIKENIVNGKSAVADLVPRSEKYFERLVGYYDGSLTIQEYIDNSLKIHFDRLIAWDSIRGFSYSLLTAAHPFISDIIEAGSIEEADLIKILCDLETIGDPISITGAIEVGFRIINKCPGIEPNLNKLVEKLRDDSLDEQSKGIRLFTSIVVLVDGELSRLKLFSKAPPFYRRLASITHAAIIYRQFIELDIDISKFEEFAYYAEGMNFLAQTYADMRLEPRWSPFMLLDGNQLKADFLGRVLISADKNKENLKGKEILKSIYGDAPETVQQRSDLLKSYRPGPLEGAEGASPNVPQDFVDAIESQLDSDEDRPHRFFLLLNSALIFKIDPKYASRTAEILKEKQYHLNNIESRDQLASILSGLATLAAATRSGSLADEVLVLLKAYRQDDEFKLTVEEYIHFGLEAAASKNEVRAWAKFVGELFRNLAFSEITSDEGSSAYTYLQCLCRCVPILWKYCAQADAGLKAFLSLSTH